jgi:DedD protein
MFDFWKRGRTVAPSAAPSRSSTVESDDVRRVRTRTRRRLMGAIVLVTLGVIAFPIVFESQPRPIPVDIPIEIPRVDGAAPLVIPAARSAGPSDEASSSSLAKADSARQAASGTLTPAPEPAPAEPAPQAASAPAVAPRAAVPAAQQPATAAPSAAPASSARTTPAKPVTESAKSPPASSSPTVAAPTPSSAASDASTKFIVQVGAFTESSAAKEVQEKLDKLGLKTYTQVADTTAGRRIRVRLGPFANRADADKAAARAREAGVATVVLKL